MVAIVINQIQKIQPEKKDTSKRYNSSSPAISQNKMRWSTSLLLQEMREQAFQHAPKLSRQAVSLLCCLNSKAFSHQFPQNSLHSTLLWWLTCYLSKPMASWWSLITQLARETSFQRRWVFSSSSVWSWVSHSVTQERDALGRGELHSPPLSKCCSHAGLRFLSSNQRDSENTIAVGWVENWGSEKGFVWGSLRSLGC